jgi:hypothetical protein
MTPGSPSRISKQLIIFTTFACVVLLSISTTPQSAAQTKRTLTATPTPAPEVPEQVDKVADVQVKSPVKVLQEGRPGVVYVIVRNISNVPITITQFNVTIDRKDLNNNPIKATPADFVAGQIIQPQHVQTLQVDLKADGQVEEGAHLLLIQIDVQWIKDGKPLTGSLIASHDFTVEVLALSGLLSVLGASSILFLPGFLAVTVFFILNRLWGKYFTGEQSQFDWKSPEFWMAALTVSLVAPYIYPWVSRLRFGERRDYRKGYGLSDVVLIWFASILGSLVCWIVYRVIRRFIVGYIEKQRSKLANYGDSLDLGPGDEPDALLDKWARRKEWEDLSLLQKLRIIRNPNAPLQTGAKERKVSTFSQGYPEYVEITVNGSAESFFLIEPLKKQAAQVLVVPQIDYRYVEPQDSSANTQQAYDEFRRVLDAAIRSEALDVGGIAELFRQGKAGGLLEVSWGEFASRDEKSPRFVSPRQLNYRPDARVPFFRQEKTR